MKILQTMMICSIALASMSAKTPFGANIYVERHHAIAIEASLRSGVPASLLLANAIIQSTFGQSIIATEANNHFNLKWYPSYGGQPMVVEEKGAYGESPGSYIRFSSVEACYVAYAQAIADNQRFKSCFLLEKTDYRAWIMAFVQCLDPSDKLYAQRLIDVIEAYDLMVYDIADNLVLDDADNIQSTQKSVRPTPAASNVPKPKFVAHQVSSENPLVHQKKETKKEENVVYEIVLPPHTQRNATGN